MSAYRIAIVGTRDTVRGFALLGLDVVAVTGQSEAIEALYRLKREIVTDPATKQSRNAYAIIFITEDMAEGLSPDDEKKLSKGALPAIIPLPSHRGSTGYGTARLKRIVERAIGSDILQ